jgi:putative SOS response-associated peptidase YedK
MCGRFALFIDLKTLIEAFGITIAPEKLTPRYNIAPSQQVVGIRPTDDGKRQLTLFRWGLIPHWAKDPAIGNKMINARAETAAEKPSFRSPFRTRRCIIPASAFFEWKKEGKQKIPYCIRNRDKTPLALAGLWDNWQGPEGVIESCSILTTEANEAVATLHNRMPVVLSRQAIEPWLDPGIKDVPLLKALLEPYPSESLKIYQVDPLVNAPQNDVLRCVEPAANVNIG